MAAAAARKVGYWERFFADAPRLECPQCRRVFHLGMLRWNPFAPFAASSERYSCPECKFAGTAAAFRQLSLAEIRAQAPAPRKKPFVLVVIAIAALFLAVMAWVGL